MTDQEKVDFYKQKYSLIVEAQKYSEHECHDISSVICYMRDCDNESIRDKLETLLQAFINRKRMGIPINFKKMKDEFVVGEDD